MYVTCVQFSVCRKSSACALKKDSTVNIRDNLFSKSFHFSALRAYCIDAHQQLLLSLQQSRVPAKLLLAEVRHVYLARSHKWQLTERTVEALQMALAGELDYDAITDSVSSKSDDVSAERAVRRYLAIANKLVRAAACGDFPSRDYFKV
jgi:hypothetical protein